MGILSWIRGGSRSAYDGGGFDRLNQNWTPVNGTGEQVNQASREVIRQRARDLERNSDNVGAIVEAMERNVVGPGIKLQAKIISEDGKDNEKLNDRIEELWRLWGRPENCDISARMSLAEMEGVAVRRRLVDGGMLFLKVYDYKSKIPFKLQAREVDDLDCSVVLHRVGTTTNKVVGGIELDDNCKAVAYHLKEYGLYGWTGKTIRVEAERIIYLSYMTRPTEIREFSPLAKIITRLRDLTQYMQAVSIKERVLACLSVFITKGNGTRNFGRGQQGTGRDAEQPAKKLSPGMIEYLEGDDDVKTVNPSGQASNAKEFVMLILRSIGAALGLSYEATSRDMSQVNYSSARQGLIDDHATYKRWQTYLITHFLEPVYSEFLMWAVLTGQIDIPDFFTRRDHYTRCMFIPKGMPWIDPVKEAKGHQIALETCQTTLEEICAEKGTDYREVLRQRAKEISMMREYGFSPQETGGNAGGKQTEGA